MSWALLAALPEEKTSSPGIVIVAVLGLVAVFSIFALASRGRRVLLPLTAILLGLAVGASSISEAYINRVSPITFLGLGMAALLFFGGLGALREGILLPEVEGVEPEISPAPPRVVPKDH